MHTVAISEEGHVQNLVDNLRLSPYTPSFDVQNATLSVYRVSRWDLTFHTILQDKLNCATSIQALRQRRVVM